MKHYLDTDYKDAKSQYVHCGLAKAIEIAFDKLRKEPEGQIGIYSDHLGAGFKGYAIKYAAGEPYFEPNLDESAA